MGAMFHGVKINETNLGTSPVNAVPAGIIALVGTAPEWAVEAPAVAPATNTPVLVGSGLDAAKFGPSIRGYSIPYALAAILAQARPGATPQVIVINVFDPTVHFTALVAQPMNFPATGAQVLNLAHMGVSAVVLKNAGATITYVLGTDYTIDAVNGLIIAISGGALTVGEAVTVSFNYADPTKVLDADIIGAISAGVYTGIQALETTYQSMGFFAKILIAPGFSQNEDVAAALLTMSNTIRARALIDSAPATSRAIAISNRGTAAQAFNTSSYRAVLCWPNVQFTDNGLVPTGVTLDSNGNPLTEVFGATAVQPLSAYAAGEWAAIVLSVGPWESPSNHELVGVLGPDIAGLYLNPFDPNSDSQLANAAGIVTLMSAFATGFRLWGNRAAAYPTYTDPLQFLCIRLMTDVIEDSEVQSMLQFIDLPLTAALIDSIIASINGFMRGYIQQGGLIDGNCSFNAAENPVLSLQAGILTLDDEFMPPTPLEQLILNEEINPGFLSELAAQVSAAQSQS
ncbi:MAG TPA: phage tail sheath subtilisin-like domain-containing protein [Candidatus Binataceae bacterium]|nr:phage tail sheath subtilisin-like domain-containing protein [Candidatus Binataceae bacterium]